MRTPRNQLTPNVGGWVLTIGMNNPAALIEEAFEHLSDAGPFDGAVDADTFDADMFGADTFDAAAYDATSDSWGATIDADVARATSAAARAAMAMADQLAAIDDTLRHAQLFPHLFIGPMRVRADAPSRDDLEFARQSAVAQLAVDLSVSEVTVTTYARTARTLRTQLPLTWDLLLLGRVCYQKARIIADTADTLPDDAAIHTRFDELMANAAPKLTPAKLRTKARAVRERLHPQDPVERHTTAAQERRVWFDHAEDGMSWQGAFLPADTAARAEARIEANARDLADQDGESRTLAQLRADVLGDLLTGDGTENAVKATVNVTVPVAALLDTGTPQNYSADPATLNGIGPIDPDTARRLCANAPSLFRLLTDPIDGAILTVDRKSYRPPADLKRLVRALMPICAFPGCNRRAEGCDVDHSLDWVLDGHTALHNLAPLCRQHHRLKHHTLWTMHRAENTGDITWSAPAGSTHGTDPPLN